MWRIKAKYATVCPLCRGYIKVGATIVQPEGMSQWAHAVCPADVRRRDQEAAAADPATCEEYKYNSQTGEMDLVTRDLEAE